MTVKQKQCLLFYLGYYVGEIDGIWGTGSKTATKSFQADFDGLKVDGIPGEETQKALRHAVAFGIQKREEPEEDVPELGTGWDNIKYFKREEFACKCGQYCDGFPVEVDLGMAAVVDKIRAEIGKPIRVNSGVRCKRHNAKVGGVSDSQHLSGNACDVQAPAGTTPEEMAEIAEKYLPNSGGIGIYPWGIHVDTRPDKARWRG